MSIRRRTAFDQFIDREKMRTALREVEEMTADAHVLGNSPGVEVLRPCHGAIPSAVFPPGANMLDRTSTEWTWPSWPVWTSADAWHKVVIAPKAGVPSSYTKWSAGVTALSMGRWKIVLSQLDAGTVPYPSAVKLYLDCRYGPKVTELPTGTLEDLRPIFLREQSWKIKVEWSGAISNWRHDDHILAWFDDALGVFQVLDRSFENGVPSGSKAIPSGDSHKPGGGWIYRSPAYFVVHPWSMAGLWALNWIEDVGGGYFCERDEDAGGCVVTFIVTVMGPDDLQGQTMDRFGNYTTRMMPGGLP